MCWPTFLGLVPKHRSLSQSCPALILEIYGFLWDTHPFWIYLVWLEILFTLTPLILVFSSKFSRVTGVTRQGWISRTRISCCGLSRPWVCEATLVSCCCSSACCRLPGSNLRGSWKNQKQHPASSQQLESDTYAAGRPDWAQLASLKKKQHKMTHCQTENPVEHRESQCSCFKSNTNVYLGYRKMCIHHTYIQSLNV